jgi:chemotaxis signal transduction protein
MAKTAIHEQAEALSVYFRDMLAEPVKTPSIVEPAIETELTDSKPVADTESQTAIESSPADVAHVIADKENFLLCQIGGMPIAISVSALNNIVHWPAAGLSQLPGQSNWQLGLLRNRDQHCEVVDIRALLQAPVTDKDLQADYILLLDQGRRGIACNTIEQIRTINADAINWRQDRRQRPWFLGVINESMHSIVDIEALLSALDNGEMA